MTRIYYTNKDGESKELLILANDDSVGQREAVNYEIEAA